ncbi:site-specific integrase [Saliphagus sp. LR7]|uniref:tyrosine-type recombinase/integrase n=1 Tax=Saliphagus sp. LR7 TaxID=2282654 RepID=UPI000DF7F0E5|nr:site-specific integrase [Saliphagus sp. LR7]
MTEICEATLNDGERTCSNKARYSDGKCGVHSSHSDSNTGGSVEDDDMARFLKRERRDPSVGKATFNSRQTGLRALTEWLEAEGPEDVRDMTPLDVEDYVIWLQSGEGRGICDVTAQDYVNELSVFIQFLQKKGEDMENPVREADLQLDPSPEMSKRLKDDQGYVAMSTDQFEELMNHLPAPTARNQLLFQLMWDCGLRPIEATQIEYEDDIDREKRQINVYSTKTGTNRVVFYSETAETMLAEWLDWGERSRFNPAEDSPYLFISRESETITTWTINQVFRKAAEAAGLHEEEVYRDAKGSPQYDLKPYSLRHSFAERMIDRGVDLETLRQTMGHSDIGTTKRYVNPDLETRRLRIQSALDD